MALSVPASPPDVRRSPLKYLTLLAPASPPDVRRGCAPPVMPKKINGAMPPVRALPSESSGSKTGGRSPNKFLVALPAGHSPASHQAAKPVRETTSDALDQPLRRHCANVSDQPVRETTSDALDQPLRRHCANV